MCSFAVICSGCSSECEELTSEAVRCLLSVGFCILYKKEEVVLPKTGFEGVCGNTGWNEKVSMSVVLGKGNKGIVSKGLEDPKFASVDETP